MRYPSAIYDIEKSPEIEMLWDEFNHDNTINPCMDCGVECEIGDDFCQSCDDNYNIRLVKMMKSGVDKYSNKRCRQFFIDAAKEGNYQPPTQDDFIRWGINK